MSWFTIIRVEAVARQRRGYRSRILWFGFCGENNSEKVVIKKLLGEDKKEKRLFLKEAKILHGIRSEHIVRFQAVCMEPCAMMLKYLFFDFAPFGRKLEELVK